MEKLEVKNILKNFVSLSFSEAATKLISALTMIYTARVLSPQGFGSINFSLAFVSYFLLLLNAGFDTIGLREIAADNGKIRKCVNTIVSTRILLAVCSYSLMLAVLFILTLDPKLKLLVAVGGLNIFAQAFTLHWVYQGLEKMHLVALRQTGNALLNLAGIYFFVKTPEDTLNALLILVVSNGLNVFLVMSIYWKQFGAFSISIDRQYALRLVRASIPITVSFTFATVSLNSDVLLIGLLRNQNEVGIYSAAIKLFSVAVIPASIVAYSFLPQFSKFLDNRIVTEKLLHVFFQSLMFVGIPVVLFGFFFNYQIMQSFFGSTYVKGHTAFAILMTNAAIVYANTMFLYPLLAWGMEKEYTKYVLIGALLSVSLNLLIIPLFGYNGAAFVKLFCELLVLMGTFSVFSNRGRLMLRRSHMIIPITAILSVSGGAFWFAKTSSLYSALVVTIVLYATSAVAFRKFVFSAAFDKAKK